jgi:hypothetical protein
MVSMTSTAQTQRPAGRMWLREQLARYSYKPGYTLTLEDDPYYLTGQRLVVRYTSPDSNPPHTHIPIKVTIPIPAVANLPDVFALWLQDALFALERHESQEWLRQDGQRYSDPHA